MAFGMAGLVHSVDYLSEIQPILKNRCGECHMDGEAKGDVSFDLAEMPKEMKEGGSIVPGDVKGSDLHWTMTLDPSEDLAMPPKGKRVPKEEIDLIAKWIEEGAKIDAGSGTMSMTGDSMSGDSMSGTGGMDAASPSPGNQPYEGIFKNRKGMQLTAKLTRIDGDRAILVLPDGKEYRYPISMFADETQDLVKKWQSGSLGSTPN